MLFIIDVVTPVNVSPLIKVVEYVNPEYLVLSKYGEQYGLAIDVVDVFVFPVNKVLFLYAVIVLTVLADPGSDIFVSKFAFNPIVNTSPVLSGGLIFNLHVV
jgi:hypothetical protein